jgi:hypothetical protein
MFIFRIKRTSKYNSTISPKIKSRNSSWKKRLSQIASKSNYPLKQNNRSQQLHEAILLNVITSANTRLLTPKTLQLNVPTTRATRLSGRNPAIKRRTHLIPKISNEITLNHPKQTPLIQPQMVKSKRHRKEV